ncbi:cell wall hydrolase [Butyrivibrio sp. INlla21]|uniref:cell wall hydrolase n=1 Tax=Butyrivibrio sp. INlla21 TaxID=1520811 RepID=UPI0008F21DFF|nr:cell wall hydrolase [Butyrivibrio sp. INlla21]SFU32911.1 Cell Wall Hydrolase [Butyrivibrio sp. INlla21]
MKKFLKGVAGLTAALLLCLNLDIEAYAEQIVEQGEYNRPWFYTEEDIAEEIRLGEMELLAQLVHAEAGNQSLYGKRLVACVVINRVKSEDFPNTVEEVIFQDGQFSVVKNGAFDDAAYNMEDTDYEAVSLEWDNQTNEDILYFNNSKNVSGSGKPFKVGDHWFNN